MVASVGSRRHPQLTASRSFYGVGAGVGAGVISLLDDAGTLRPLDVLTCLVGVGDALAAAGFVVVAVVPCC